MVNEEKKLLKILSIQNSPIFSKILILIAKEKRILNRIREVLEAQGRSQTWLANQLDVAFGTVNGWCSNRGQPYLTDLINAAEVLEVAPADLIVDGTKKEKGLKENLETFIELS